MKIQQIWIFKHTGTQSRETLFAKWLVAGSSFDTVYLVLFTQLTEQSVICVRGIKITFGSQGSESVENYEV